MSKRAVWAAAARRNLPASTARYRARVATALAVRDDRVMDRARRNMELLVGAARPDADVEALARGHVAYGAWINEWRWHRSLCRPIRVEGLEHLRSVEGGTIVNFVHHGPFVVIGDSLAESGRDIQVMVDPSLCPPQKQPWQAQAYAMGTQRSTAFSAAEGSAGIRERLASGAVVGLASDVPGRSVVSFLGRQLVGSSGAARIAFATGTPVVPCTTRRDDSGTPYYRLLAPVDPSAFAGPEELLAELLRLQEDAVLAWPEAYHDPLSKWSTELPASAEPQQKAAS